MALYWTHILLHAGEKKARDYILKRLSVESSETFIDATTKQAVNAVMNICYSNTFWETDGIYHLVLLMSSRWKDETMLTPITTWRESRLWLKFEILRTYLEWITPDIFAGKNKWVKVPSYALDQHTAFGKKAYSAGMKIDNRFSGSTDGRRSNMEIMMLRNLINNPVNTDTDFPRSQKKSEYKTLYKMEQLQIPFRFPRNLQEVDLFLKMDEIEFKKEIKSDLITLDELGYYDKNKA